MSSQSPHHHDHTSLSTDHSPMASTPGSPRLAARKRVGFNVSPGNELDQHTAGSDSRSGSDSPSYLQLPTENHVFDPAQLTRSLNELSKVPMDKRVTKSALRKGTATPEALPALDLAGIPDLHNKERAYESARARASGLERDIRSAPGSRSSSPDRNLNLSLAETAHKRPGHHRASSYTAAIWNNLFHHGGEHTGQNTPDAEEMDEYFPPPPKYRATGLSAHWLINNWHRGGGASASHSRQNSLESGMSTPSTPPDEKSSWFPKSPRSSTPSIVDLVRSTGSTTAIAGADVSQEYRKASAKRPAYHRSPSSSSLTDTFRPWNQQRPKKKKDPVDITIKKHIEETNQRKRYLLKLCRALMEYGAPTHRLEAYMSMTARVLAIEAQFLYFPGTMVISFDDSQTHTAEMKLVRVAQGVDLGKMKDTHDIYKDVVHDLIGVQEAMTRLETVSKKGQRYPVWAQILAYGFGSAAVGPFAFQARLIDLPIAFGLGCILGALQLLVAPRSDLYSSVFEIAATIITSFLSRFFGSLRHSNLFCFSALAQSSIAIILPGFTVLSAALELQSRSLVAGSVRIVYAVIYSLWLGYGITIGTAIYGIIDHKASSNAQCINPLADDGYWIWLFVPIFTFCLAVINQAKWKQMPIMLFISFIGYQVNYWSSQRFPGNAQVASTLGALAIGVVANLYSRTGRVTSAMQLRMEIWFHTRILGYPKETAPHILTTPASPKDADRRRSSAISFIPRLFRTTSEEGTDKDVEALGDSPTKPLPSTSEEKPEIKTTKDGKPVRVNYALAAAAMLPAIFVQVPSGLSVTGSLVQGIESANQISNQTQGVSVLSATDITNSNGNVNGNVSFTVAASVVQIAIGICVGLFLGSIVVYPTGKGGSIGHGKKSRSGLFAF